MLTPNLNIITPIMLRHPTIVNDIVNATTNTQQFWASLLPTKISIGYLPTCANGSTSMPTLSPWRSPHTASPNYLTDFNYTEHSSYTFGTNLSDTLWEQCLAWITSYPSAWQSCYESSAESGDIQLTSTYDYNYTNFPSSFIGLKAQLNIEVTTDTSLIPSVSNGVLTLYIVVTNAGNTVNVNSIVLVNSFGSPVFWSIFGTSTLAVGDSLRVDVQAVLNVGLVLDPNWQAII